MKEEMVSHLLANQLITKDQHGFLSKKSVTSQLLECTNDWTKCIADQKPFDIVYLDFSKAFDSVSHTKLLQKLSSYGFSGLLLSWLKAFLWRRKQRVLVGDAYSDYADVVSGVPQGSVLGPILFLLCVDDIIDMLNTHVGTNAKLKLFADDVKLYSSVPINGNHSDANLLLESVCTWARK